MRSILLLIVACCAVSGAENPPSISIVGVVTAADPSEVHAHRADKKAHSIEYYDVVSVKVEAPSELAGTSVRIHLPVPKYSASTQLIGQRISVSLPKASLEPIEFRLSGATASIQEMPNLK